MKLVANALNKGEMARAMMAAVLMRLPDPGGPIRIADVDGVLAKAGFNPDEPRDERGRWTNGGDSGNVKPGITGVELADAGMSDASDDPVAQAAARAAAAARRNSRAGGSRDRPVTGERGNYWQTLVSDLSDRAESLLSEIGRAQINESNANLAVGTAEARAIAEGFDASIRFMEQPIGGSMPITPETPIWGYGDDARLAPERPINVGDAVGAVGSALPFLPFGEGASAAAELPELLESESNAFIVLPSELPKNFNTTLPIGRYVIPKDAVPGTTTYGDLVGRQIGDLVKNASPDVTVILRTEPGAKGVDIEIPIGNVSDFGFQYAEIKPISNSAVGRFKSQVVNWDLPAPVQVITYNYRGNIYYGFPW